jgi:hypothetical protein
MAAAEPSEAPPVSYEELAEIEDEFEAIDVEIMRKNYLLSKPIYAKRAEAVAKIDKFWPLVFEQAPPEIDQFIAPQDSHILNEHLKSFEVTRPDVDANDEKGNPRSLKLRFEFSEGNEFFEETVLEKQFWYRRASDGWTGLVSEPVKITWKKDKDLTEGLTDGALELFEARKKAGDFTAKGLPEYTALAKKVENWHGGNTSFFTFFGWVSDRRYVSAEESEKANKEYQARREAKKKGEKVEPPKLPGDDGEEDEMEQYDSAVEVHPAGEELAIQLAEELWPSAIKLFTQAQEMDDEEMSEADFEDDEDEDDEDGVEAVDIRALVQGKEKGRQRDSLGSSGPPSKKVKK